MHEILFRGKRFDNGEWVEGGYIPLDVDSGYTYIIEPCNYASTLSVLDLIKLHSILVIPKTVGQYTGLTDKNGKKIFEGDIVITKTTSCKFVGCILYSTEYVRFVCVTKSKMSYPMDSKFEYEVIGNIHDNPELLKGGGEE